MAEKTAEQTEEQVAQEVADAVSDHIDRLNSGEGTIDDRPVVSAQYQEEVNRLCDMADILHMALGRYNNY